MLTRGALPPIWGDNGAVDESAVRVIPAFVVEWWLFATKPGFTCAEALIVRKKLAIKAAIISFFI
jgi:hypothetical protein